MIFSEALAAGSGTSIETVASNKRPRDVGYPLNLTEVGPVRKIELARPDRLPSVDHPARDAALVAVSPRAQDHNPGITDP